MWTEKKKYEVVVSYLALGKAPLVELVTGVPAGTVRQWKTQPWWKEYCDQVQIESDQELDSKLQGRIEKVLDVVNDRLINGDFIFNPQTGSFIRKPVSLRDSWKAGKEMIDVRLLLRKQRSPTVDQQAVADILKGLALEFSQMAKKRLSEKIIEGEVINAELSVGVQELSGEIRSDQETSNSECSPAIDGESRISP